MGTPGTALLLLLCGYVATESQYVFTAPKVLTTASSEPVCLLLLDPPGPGQLTLEMLDKGSSVTNVTREVQAEPGVSWNECFDFEVPNITSFKYDLHLSVTFAGDTNYTINDSQPVTARGIREVLSPKVYIQTDKAVYKPGQKVFIRLLAVDERLRPLPNPLPLVYVMSPLRTRLAQWRDVQGPAGLAQLEFQLDDDPTLGDWKIQVETKIQAKGHELEFSKEFKVDEIVLPKFEVKIKGPAVVYIAAETLSWKICGKYTHGKPVHGVANISLSILAFGSSDVKVIQSQHTKGNCAQFSISPKALGLDCYHRGWKVVASGSITEDGTGVTLEAEEATSSISDNKYKIEGGKQDQAYVKPGLPFTEQVRVTRFDGGASAGVTVKLCFSALNDGGETNGANDCKNLTSDNAGVVSFGILLQNLNTTKVLIQIDSTVETAQLSCGDTASLPVRVTAPGPGPLTLFYQVMAEGRIVLFESVSVPLDEPLDADDLLSDFVFGRSQDSDWQQHPLGAVTLSVPVDQRLSSGFSLLVFTLLDGEVVADSHLFDATPCLQNKVSLAWKPQRAAPKDSVSLRLTASPGSVCGVDVVDKSVSLLSTDNRVSVSNYFAALKSLNMDVGHIIPAIDDDEYCEDKHGDAEDWAWSKEDTEELPEERNEWFRPPVYEYSWRTSFLDSLSAFDISWLALSDAALETRPCHQFKSRRWPYGCFDGGCNMWARRGFIAGGLPGPAMMPLYDEDYDAVAMPMLAESGAQGQPQPNAAAPPASKPRTYFPETWLFDLHTVGPDGVVTLTPHAPDTITEWVAGAVCSSQVDGMGLAAPASITTFQPFFITYTLPYSVKRGETLVLKVSVLNYNDHQLPVRLTLRESEEFETLTAPVLTSCVDAATPEVVSFKLRPRQLGQVNISVVAEVYPEFPGACGPETIFAFSDAVIRPMLVEPEGFEREVVHSQFVCITPEKRELTTSPEELELFWPLELPQNLVPGSERAHVAVVGELLGPSLDNLERLVKQPTGCGEQNMVLFSPNIHVMKYLSAVGELTEEMKQKLTTNMKTGYQRELNYRHDDKSFSAFGNSDASGSMWLTAFVVKSFGDASKFISVDDDDLRESVRWIEKQQTKGGCFPNVGRMLNKAMKGGVTSGGQQALTAYVTAALISSGVRLRESTVPDAFRCLTKADSTYDPYTLTLITHARALAGQLAQARQNMVLLGHMAVRVPGLVYWHASGGEENRALNVEVSAYNVLTMAILDKESGQDDFFLDSLAAVRWITEQRNSQGGFVSTQDTVLALEALAAFSLRIPRSENTDMTLYLSDEHGTDESLHVTAANRLLTQRRPLETLPAQLRVRADGTGCGLVQAILKYNVKDPAPKEAFEMSITTSAKIGQKECLKHSIEICVRYLGEDDESNMAVVEVEMVSGIVPSKPSLRELKQDPYLELKRWDVNNNKLAFYFDSLPAAAPPRCFELRVYREQVVEDVKPAVAKVYDYYQTERQISLNYEFDAGCEKTLEFPPATNAGPPFTVYPPSPELLPPVDGRRGGRFDGWWDARAPLALPQGVGGPFAVLRPPPEGFWLAEDEVADAVKEEEEEGPECPVCLDPIRTADFRHYLCLEGDLFVARLSELGKLTYVARWKTKGSRRAASGSQQLVIDDGCECQLDTGRPLYLFGVTGEERRQQQLQLTDQHVLAAAPAAKRLQRRQLQLAIGDGCQ